MINRTYFILALFATSLWADAARPQLRTVLVNGGYDESSNWDMHERDIKFFYDFLGPKNSVVLNAGDTPTKRGEVLASDGRGYLKRTPAGDLTKKPSMLKMETDTASLENVKKALTAAADEKPKHFVGFYGDHGNAARIALWGTKDDWLDLDTLREQYDKFPKDTLIQSVHFHCFAGAYLADPDRKVPSGKRALSSFISNEYPTNRCGIATSNEDDSGTYVDWGQQNSAYLNQLKATHPQLSLDELRDYIEQNPKRGLLSVLTSDYFAEDIIKHHCRQDPESHWPPPVSLQSFPTLQEGTHSSKQSRPIDAYDVCGETSLERKVKTIKNKIEEIRNLRYEMIYMRNTVSTIWTESMEYKALGPSKYRDLAQARKSLESVEKQLEAIEEEIEKSNIADAHLASEEVKLKEEQDFLKSTRDALAPKIPEIDKSITNQHANFLFGTFFKTKEGKSWMENHPKNNKLQLVSKFYKPGMDLWQLEADFQTQIYKQQDLLKNRLFEQRKLRKKYAEELMKTNPLYKRLKKRYENIRECEKTPLNS